MCGGTYSKLFTESFYFKLTHTENEGFQTSQFSCNEYVFVINQTTMSVEVLALPKNNAFKKRIFDQENSLKLFYASKINSVVNLNIG